MYIVVVTISIAIIGLICVGLYYNSKTKTVDMICNHPELSDEKVKSITAMMTKRHKDFIDITL